MLSNNIPLTTLFEHSVSKWDFPFILRRLAAVVDALRYGSLPVHSVEVNAIVLQLASLLADPAHERYHLMVSSILVTLLGAALLASRLITSPLDLASIGLSTAFIHKLNGLKTVVSSPYATGLLFLLQLQLIHQQHQRRFQEYHSDEESLDGDITATTKHVAHDWTEFQAAARLASQAVRRIAELQRMCAAPFPDDVYIINLTHHAFYRHTAALTELIHGYALNFNSATPTISHSASMVNHGDSCDMYLSLGSFRFSNLALISSILQTSSSEHRSTISIDSIPHTEDTSQQQALVISDLAYILFLLESYTLVFPGQSLMIADVLCDTLYLPQAFITSILSLLAPPILRELSACTRRTNRNRCIVSLIFMHTVLAQTVHTFQYAVAARAILRKMKVLWTRVYVPTSVLPPTKYFFGARSDVFQITPLEDGEYAHEILHLLSSNTFKTRSSFNSEAGSRRRRSLKK